MNVTVIEQPPVEPVTLEEAKAYLRVDDYGSPATNPDDAMIQTMIVAARETVEQVTRRSFIQRRLLMVADLVPTFWQRDRKSVV